MAASLDAGRSYRLVRGDTGKRRKNSRTVQFMRMCCDVVQELSRTGDKRRLQMTLPLLLKCYCGLLNMRAEPAVAVAVDGVHDCCLSRLLPHNFLRSNLTAAAAAHWLSVWPRASKPLQQHSRRECCCFEFSDTLQLKKNLLLGLWLASPLPSSNVSADLQTTMHREEKANSAKV